MSHGAETYEVDAAMMGSDWTGDRHDLRKFCAHLQDVVGDRIRIVCITDSYNGAQNDDDVLVSLEEFNAAWKLYDDDAVD